MSYDIFDLQGTPAQNAIILDALQKCDFPWERLLPKLQSTKGKSKIPVVWEDLNAYAAQGLRASEDGHDHSHEHDESDNDADHADSDVTHSHVVGENGEVLAHGVGFRSRILGLAWYSGKVSVDLSLESNPTVAKEVFLSEGAHMIDFFYMTDQQRSAIFNAFHGSTTTPAERGHAWFDVGDYYSWVGEAFMGGFVKAYSSFPVTIDFVHPPTTYTNQRIREILTPDLVTPVAPKPLPPQPGSGKTPPFPSPPEVPYLSTKGSPFFHKGHKGIKAFTTWPDRKAALAARKRPCSVCKP